ncbi:MAG: hypothetical protein H9893_08670 [Candidatus Niameybacter stercoravium]|nr:hypothetical protein [Candidatus Niameybacter stercoravium]
MYYQANDFDVATLSKELKALYPTIESLSMGKLKSISATTGEPVYAVVATVDTQMPLSSTSNP